MTESVINYVLNVHISQSGLKQGSFKCMCVLPAAPGMILSG